MKDVEKMKRDLNKKVEELRGLIEKETRSDEDKTRIESLMTEAETIRAEINTEERAQAILMQEKQKEDQREVDERSQGFAHFGDFVQHVRFRPQDDRFIRAQNMGTGSEGGVLVPTLFRDEILTITPQGSIFRGSGATVIPADTEHPDAALTMPALDYSGGKGMYGGVAVQWIGEGDEKPQTTAAFTDVSLTPHEVAGHIVVTDKLLRNSNAAGTVLRTLLRGAIMAAEDDQFLNGNGVAKPLGVINSAATVAVNRGTASQVLYSDVVGMYAKVNLGGSLNWTASQSIIPQLMQMVDGQGNLIWQPSAREGQPDMLLGRPIKWNERSPQLGVKGDLTLMDASYYLIKDGSPLAISASEHVYFNQNKTVIKAFWMVDGQSWLKDKITQEGGYAVSPFVVLDVPSV